MPTPQSNLPAKPEWPQTITTTNGVVINPDGSFTTPETTHDGFRPEEATLNVSHQCSVARDHVYMLARQQITTLLLQQDWRPDTRDGEPWDRYARTQNETKWMSDGLRLLPPHLHATLLAAQKQIWTRPPHPADNSSSIEFGTPAIQIFAHELEGEDDDGDYRMLVLVAHSLRFGVPVRTVNKALQLACPLSNNHANALATFTAEIEYPAELWAATQALTNPDFQEHVTTFRETQAQIACTKAFYDTLGETRMDDWCDEISFGSYRTISERIGNMETLDAGDGAYGFTVVGAENETIEHLTTSLNSTEITQTVTPTVFLTATMGANPAVVMFPAGLPWREHLFALRTSTQTALHRHSAAQLRFNNPIAVHRLA